MLFGLLVALALVLLVYLIIVPSHKGNLPNMAGHPFDNSWDFGDVELPHGRTHYYLLGPENGPKVVFVHGITSPAPCFPGFIQGMADKGFRVLCYDLYGRGLSDSPGVVYDDALYVSQLASLLLKLGWKKTHVVGLSLGGAITVNFVTKFPELVDKIAWLAPAGLMEGLPLLAQITQIPILGAMLFFGLGPVLQPMVVRSNLVVPADESEGVKHALEMNLFQIKHHKGMRRAFYSTLSHFNFGGHGHRFAECDVLFPNRVIALWGDQDTVVPFALSKKLSILCPSAKLVIRKGLGHNMIAEDAEFCVKTVSAFLNKKY